MLSSTVLQQQTQQQLIQDCQINPPEKNGMKIAVIGAGPAGMAAAISAKKNGAEKVIIIERENRMGGILKQCIHAGFGLQYFGEELTGPEYAEKFSVIAKENGIEFMLNTTAIEIKDKTLVCVNTEGVVNIHFTVSPEHIAGFDDVLAKIVPEFESDFGVKYDISKSVQKSSTDTIAVNLDNTPFRNDDGTLLFRPAGHGALIENLNDIDADLIFIKNIDNVCPDEARVSTVVHKKRLAGLAMKLQTRIFEYMRALDLGAVDADEIVRFINDNLGIVVDKNSDLRAILNRPLRVCGIIKNTGEPGGGPFWVRGADGTLSLQIVEPGQIAPENIGVLKNGEFFSPVDLVCLPRDYMGNKFDLIKYVDPTAGFISEKSKNGHPLRAMERPGLWNGAMANWNTVFVETPLDTFTPVKVVSDLLGAGHRSNE